MREPVNYVAVGAVFPTSIKGPRRIRRSDWRSCARLRRSAPAHAKPLVAIGGITLETAPAVIDAGAATVAVISDLLAGDPAERARQYVSVLGT